VLYSVPRTTALVYRCFCHNVLCGKNTQLHTVHSLEMHELEIMHRGKYLGNEVLQCKLLLISNIKRTTYKCTQLTLVQYSITDIAAMKQWHIMD